MSRPLVDLVRQELARPRACHKLYDSLRHKSSAATTVKSTAVEFWPFEASETEPMRCPVDHVSRSPSQVQARQWLTAQTPPLRSTQLNFTTATAGITHGNVPLPGSFSEDDVTSSSSEAAASASSGTVRPFSEMPSPFSLPILGTIWMHLPGGPLYGLSFEEKTAKMEEMYGPIIREHVIFNFHIVHAYKPEDIETVFRNEGKWPVRDSFRMLSLYNKLYSNNVQGIVSSQGEHWHKLRSAAQVKMMKPKSPSAYIHLHNDVANDFVTVIGRLRNQDGIVEDILPQLYKFAMEGIGCVCFNRRLGALEKEIPEDSDTWRFIRAVADVMEASQDELKGFTQWSPSFKKLVKAQRFIRELSLKEAARTLEASNASGSAVDGESGDLIPYLLTKTELSEAEVMTIISEFFFAGVDTTSHFLGFCLYMLSTNPEAQEKLRQEIDEVIDGSDEVSPNALGRMSYLKAVTKETFRMCPITPGNGRTLTKDVVLSGYHVPAGMMVGLHHDTIGKNPRYVREPDRFIPERWLRGSKSYYGNIHPFVVMPFGFGPRSCVGRRFAEQEFSLALIKVLQAYRVEYAHDEAMKYTVSIVNKPTTPLKFRFVPRN